MSNSRRRLQFALRSPDWRACTRIGKCLVSAIFFRQFYKLVSSWSSRFLALLPMSFASNYFYAYQGAVNAAYFNGPTRALNAVLEAAGAIIGALLIGYCVLDIKGVHRRTRGYLGLGIVAGMVIIVWSALRLYPSISPLFTHLFPGQLVFHGKLRLPEPMWQLVVVSCLSVTTMPVTRARGRFTSSVSVAELDVLGLTIILSPRLLQRLLLPGFSCG